jgi:hypothetical protein
MSPLANRIIRPGELPQLALETRAYEQIPNAPVLSPDPDRLERYVQVQQNLHPGAQLRRVAGFYNCFGLVFGGRRTWIGDLYQELSDIYRGDEYRKVAFTNLRVGDLVMYKHQNRIEHVAMVMSLGPWMTSGGTNETRSVQVLSKWGNNGEFLHDMLDFDLGDPVEFWTERE